MVKNAPSSSNLRGSTSNLAMRPSQEIPRAAEESTQTSLSSKSSATERSRFDTAHSSYNEQRDNFAISNADQEARHLGFRTHAPKSKGYTSQSTLFSQFDSSLRSEKQTEGFQSGYDAFKLEGLERSSFAPPSSISANPGFAHASADAPQPAEDQMIDYCNTINAISADGRVVPVPYPIVPPSPSFESFESPHPFSMAGSDIPSPAKESSLYAKYMEEITRERLQRSNCAPSGVKCEMSGPSANLSDTLPSHAVTQTQFGSQARVVSHPSHGARIQSHGQSLITKGSECQVTEQNALKSPEAYTKPFCEFLTENPTVWHAVQYFEKKLDTAGFKKVRFFPL